MKVASKTPRRQVGRYEVLCLVASGGMADIQLAVRSGAAGFEKLVVIKSIRPMLSGRADVVDMFLEEARLAALLNHTNTVQVFDLFEEDGQYYLVMEYLHGEPLSTIARDYRDRDADMPYNLAAAVVMQAADGLDHAHGACAADGALLRLVHRDVSPDNVMVLYSGVAKIVDFGIAKTARSLRQTRAGTLKGKLAYMSPEQVRCEELDARSDIFSLGIVLWECLVGQYLFPETDEESILGAIQRVEVVPPRVLRPEVPAALSDVAVRALQRNRDERFQSAAAMYQALVEHFASDPEAGSPKAVAAHLGGLLLDRRTDKERTIDRALQQDEAPDADSLRTVTSYLVTGNRTLRPEDLPPPQGRRHWWWAAGLGLLAALGGVGGMYGYTTFLSPAQDPAAPAAGAAEPARPPLPPVQPVRPPVSPLESSPDASEALEAPSKTKRRQTGTLRLSTVPWTNVFFRGRSLGQTPLVDVVLPAGRVRLRVVNRDAKVDQTIAIVIKPNARVSKRIRLTK